MKTISGRKSKIPYGLAIFAGILWGTTGTSQAFAPPGTSPLAVGAVRIALGGLTLLAFALWQGKVQTIKKPWPVRTVLIAAAGISLCQLFFFAAVLVTGVSIGTIVSMGSAPIIAGIFGHFFCHEKITRRWCIATALAVAGCILIANGGNHNHTNILGIFLALGAGTSYAGYTTTSKHLVDTQPVEGIIAVVFCIGALLLAPVFFLVDMHWLLSLGGITMALHLGVITTALAFALFSYSLKQLPVATASTLGLAEPLTAAILGIVVLGEKLSFSALIGILLILAGITFLTLPGRQSH